MTDTPAPLSPVAVSVVECVRKHVRNPTFSVSRQDRAGIAEAIEAYVVDYDNPVVLNGVIADLATRLEAAKRENERLRELAEER